MSGHSKVGRILRKGCPECGSDMILRESIHGIFYGCVQYPRCKGAHGAHADSGLPLGVPANNETKQWRQKAHAAFDQLWSKPGSHMNRQGAYVWLCGAMQMTEDEAHIGRFTKEQCQHLIEVIQFTGELK